MPSIKVSRVDNIGVSPVYDYYIDGQKLTKQANKTGFIDCLNKFLLADFESDTVADWSYGDGVLTEATTATTINASSVALTLNSEGELTQGTPTDIAMKLYLLKTQFDSRINRPATISSQGDLTW